MNKKFFIFDVIQIDDIFLYVYLFKICFRTTL